MVIGVCSLELYIPYSRSLKEKRMAVKGLKDFLRHNHNVSVAEVDHQDLWQRSRVALAAVAGDQAGCETILQGAVAEAQRRFKCEILDVIIEYLSGDEAG